MYVFVCICAYIFIYVHSRVCVNVCGMCVLGSWRMNVNAVGCAAGAPLNSQDFPPGRKYVGPLRQAAQWGHLECVQVRSDLTWRSHMRVYSRILCA